MNRHELKQLWFNLDRSKVKERKEKEEFQDMFIQQKHFKKNYNNVIADMTIRGSNLVTNNNNHRRL